MRRTLTEALATAKKPLIITSYLGRNTESVAELVVLSERLAVPVISSGPYMNFPTDHPMNLGPAAQPLLKDADTSWSSTATFPGPLL
jgi:acetolactate synthase-1/2/3 large subunit